MQNRKSKKQILFTRRSFIASSFITVAFGAIFYRLQFLQLKRNKYYQSISDNNQFREKIILPSRGVILDRYGELLSVNVPNYMVLMIPSHVDNIDRTLDILKNEINYQNQELLKNLRKKINPKSDEAIIIFENLTWKEFTKINFIAAMLKGIIPDVGETRFYPYKDVLSHVTGFVGAVTTADLKNTNARRNLLYRQAGILIGKQGLEKSLNDFLIGDQGKELVQVNVYGKIVKSFKEKKIESKTGLPVFTTIDIKLQEYIHQLLKDISASAVVINIANGDILSLVSTPSFDPNKFSMGIDQKEWNKLRNNPLSPLLNKSVSGQYPPGSTFKMITALAALEKGINPKDKVNCKGRIYFGNRWFNCWKRKGHYRLSMENAISQSCDVFFYELAKKLDVDEISLMASKLGIGEKFEINIEGVKSGVNPSREWKRQYYGANSPNGKWFGGDSLSLSIGQGYLLSTPLQLAVMTGRIASAIEIKPRLIRAIGSDQNNNIIFKKLDIKQEYLDIVKRGMYKVVNETSGTSYQYNLGNDYRFAGKTGTSQVAKLKIDPKTNKPYKNDELPRHLRDHALFVAFAPFEDPRYAISVIVEHGGGGSSVAAPIAKKIVEWLRDNEPAKKPTLPWDEYMKKV